MVPIGDKCNPFAFLKTQPRCPVNNDLGNPERVQEERIRNVLRKEMESRLKREEVMWWSFRACFLKKYRFLGHVKYSFEMLLIHLKENLPVQFVIFTNGNQLLRCSHRETDGWIYPGLGFCQEILWMENMVDENWGRSTGAKAFCKEVIITIYHWILMGSDGKEKMGRKIDGRNLWNDASGIYFNNWIRWRLMGENRPFHLYYFKCNTLSDYGNIQNVTMGERWAAGKTH